MRDCGEHHGMRELWDTFGALLAAGANRLASDIQRRVRVLPQNRWARRGTSMDSAQRVRRFGRFRPLGRCRPLMTVLIVPVVLLAAVPILVGLLGIFVIWLIGVSSLVA